MNGLGALTRRLLLLLLIGPLFLHMALGGTAKDFAGDRAGRWVDAGLVAASGLPHAIIYTALLVVFASSLRRGRVPLITLLSRRMYDVVSDEMAAYTRGVTWAWCTFFAAQLAASLALFLWAPLTLWSLFVNLLNLPLLALMFIAEHTCRPFLLKNAPRHSMSDVRRILIYLKEGLFGVRAG